MFFKVIVMKTYDFRYRDSGCTTHPVVKLVNLLKSTSENVIEVYVLKDDIPIQVLRLFAQMSGFSIKEVEDGGEWIRVIMEKRS